MWLMQNGMSELRQCRRSSHDYLHLIGLTALAYMWALQAKAALAGGSSRAAPQSARSLFHRQFVPRRHRHRRRRGALVFAALPPARRQRSAE
jgi:hypothetical protein